MGAIILDKACFTTLITLCCSIFLIATEVTAIHSGQRRATIQGMRSNVAFINNGETDIEKNGNSFLKDLAFTLVPRGGGEDNTSPMESTNDTTNTDDDDENDEERYSRQFYTLGARAHTLVRQSSILVDGPPTSGLVYECVKNLALSGVGQIVIVTSSNNVIDEQYHHQGMDDLGNVYLNSARAECPQLESTNDNEEEEEEEDNVELLIEYIRRLNPSVKVQRMERSDLLNRANDDDYNDDDSVDELVGENPVFLCIDRPQSTQILLNDACRNLEISHDSSTSGNDDETDSSSLDLRSIPFVSIETAGVYGRAFCDFGDHFQVVDEDGETPKLTLIESVSYSKENEDGSHVFEVKCIDGEKHDVSKGDQIIFQWKNGNEEDQSSCCEVVYVNSPISLSVRMISDEGDLDTSKANVEEFIDQLNNNANSFTRIKIPKTMTFLPLSNALKEQNDLRKALFAASDLDKSFDMNRRGAIMSSFQALNDFVQEKKCLPSIFKGDSGGKRYLKDFLDLSMGSRDDCNKQFKKIVKSFAFNSKAKFTPIQALFGALGAQEVLKGASGLYNPIKQFLLYDCDEIIRSVKPKDKKLSRKGVSGMSFIIGKKAARKLASQKIFVVGSGAIGCEILKNLAAMGAGTNKKKDGRLILTDMDTIEKSNLSRQLLFRDGDVGKFKSVAAKEAVFRFNSLVNVDVHTSKVGDDTKDGHFDDKFWSSGVDVVLNALDNVEARLFIDGQCIANQKGLIDAGTLGAKGNVQVVVPNQSESYGSSADPPEPTIPVCTLKNFPYEISHTIQWARDTFDGLFTRRPAQVNESMEKMSTTNISDFAQSMLRKLGDEAAMEAANEMSEDFVHFDTEDDMYFDNVRRKSIEWAVELSQNFFYKSMKELLQKHPKDSVDEDGEQFWSGTRRAPKPLNYSTENLSSEQEMINEYLVDFVRHAARLRIETYLDQSMLPNGRSLFQFSDVTTQDVMDAFQNLSQQSHEVVETESNGKEDDNTSVLRSVTNKLKLPKAISPQIKGDLTVASFEKDDNANGHISFITAASNLRALCYGITPIKAMETRRIAGRIIPAMITTTAFVSALSCLELVKILQTVPLELHRNAFVNLALPFFAFTPPLPAEEMAGLNGATYTIWDRVFVKESEKHNTKGGITLRKLISRVQKKVGTSADSEEATTSVSSVSYGPYLLYANFLHADDNSILDKPIWQLVKEAIISGEDDDLMDFSDDDSTVEPDSESLTVEQEEEIEKIDQKSFIDLTVMVEDSDTFEEAELPPVRVVRWTEQP